LKFKYTIYIIGIVFHLLLYYSCRQAYHIESNKSNGITFSIDSLIISVDSQSVKLIAPYKEKLNSEISEVIAYSDVPLYRNHPESPLTNLLGDIVLSETNYIFDSIYNSKADFCVLNYHGIRGSLPKGAITVGDIYQMLPFDNKIVVLTIKGDSVNKLFKYLASRNGEIIAGASYGIKTDKPYNIIINNIAFDSTRLYKLVTSDYLADGGDNMIFLSNPLKSELIDYNIRDFVIKYMRNQTSKGIVLNPKSDNRVYYVK